MTGIAAPATRPGGAVSSVPEEETHSTAWQAVDAALAGPTPFAAFHRDRLLAAAAQLEPILRPYDHSRSPDRAQSTTLRINVETATTRAIADLLSELNNLAARSLVAGFHEFRASIGLPPSKDSSAAFAKFVDRLTDPEFTSSIEKNLPLLTELLDRVVQQRVQLITDLVSHAAADWATLSTLGLAPGGPVIAFLVSSGDAHNEGNRVAIVHSTDGRLVHKPRSLALDQAFTDATEVLAPYLEPSCPLRLPKSLNRGHYGWQEHISAAPMTEPEQVRRHRYRLGAFLALFAALGSTDLHHENVITDGEYPMFIDLETVLQHQPEPDETGSTARLSSPLLQTLLLPMRVAGQQLDVDLSGIGTVTTQHSLLPTSTILDGGTDAVRFERSGFDVQHRDNLAYLGDVPLPATVGADDLIVGFRDALTGLREQRTAVISKFANTNPQVRQVVRPTHVYARFLAASTHPRYLGDSAERRRLLTSLKPVTTIKTDALDRFTELETVALLRHDIPYFEVTTNGLDLRAPLDGSTPAAYSVPLIERVASSLDNFLGTPVRQHEHTIRMCLSTTSTRLALNELDDRPDPSAYGTTWLAPHAGPLSASISGLLTDTAHHVDRGQAVWLTPSVEGTPSETSSLLFRPGDISIYETGGIAWLLAAAAHHANDESLAALAQCVLPQQLPQCDPEQNRGLSWYAGIAGSAALAHELHTFAPPGDDRFSVLRDDLLTKVVATTPTPTHEVDLMGGYSATAAYLSALAPIVPQIDLETFLRRSVAGMKQALADNRLPVGELAHGDIGVAWSLARTANYLGDEQGLEAAQRVLTAHVAQLEQYRGEIQVGSAKPRSHQADASWCKGTAGSLIALSEALPLVGWLPGEVDQVVDALVEIGSSQICGRGRDISPCHGSSGWVQALNHAGQLRGRLDLQQQARRVLDEQRARSAAEGYIGGIANSQGFLGYMLGLTGLAHSEVLLDHPTWGSPLSLTPTLAIDKEVRSQ